MTSMRDHRDLQQTDLISLLSFLESRLNMVISTRFILTRTKMVTCLVYADIPKTFFMPHHQVRSCTIITRCHSCLLSQSYTNIIHGHLYLSPFLHEYIPKSLLYTIKSFKNTLRLSSTNVILPSIVGQQWEPLNPIFLNNGLQQ
jgi:hypothetical protein